MGFVTALLLAAQPIKSLGTVTTATLEGLAAAERVYELLDEKPTVVDRPGARPLAVDEGAIVFDDVGFGYAAAAGKPGGAQLLAHRAGRQDGSARRPLGRRQVDRDQSRRRGCSTSSAGRIRIDGQDVREVTLASLRQAIAIVSQEVTLFDDTIRANIALGRLGASDADIVAAAKAAAAHEFIIAQPRATTR